MAKKPDLMPGEYGIKVEYRTETMRRITVWVGEVFPSMEEAEVYLYSHDPGGSNENCAGVYIVDWEGKVCGGGFYD